MRGSFVFAVPVALLLVSTPAQSQSTPVPDARAIAEACRNIGPWDRLRIQTDLGTFEGRVKHVGPDGLSGLRAAQSAAMDPIPELITWDRIQRIDRGGSTATIGAKRGALGLGIVGAALGILANTISDGYFSVGEWGSAAPMLAGGAAGAAVGAVLGAAVTSGGTRWSPVYPR